jgi:hypothetical protein
LPIRVLAHIHLEPGPAVARPGETQRLMPDHKRALLAPALLLCGLLTACNDGADPEDEDFGETSTLLSGELGDLGPLKPTVSSFVIENSGEVLIYMSSATLTCPEIMVSRWLGDAPAGAQVVEIVVPSERAVDTVQVEEGGAEVNYAAGGKSSAYEKSAIAGHVTFTRSLPGTVVEGSFSATFADAGDSVKGRFQAEYCEGGQGY